MGRSNDLKGFHVHVLFHIDQQVVSGVNVYKFVRV